MLFFTDPERTPRPWETAARLPAGAGVVFRAFGQADALETGRRLREATRAAGVELLVGLDVALAEMLEADGLHLPERALGEAEALRAAHEAWLLTGAVHSVEAARAAPGTLDAVVLSPIFPAGGTSGAKPPLGVETLKTVAALRATYALGGVTAETAAALANSGACGFAAIGAIAAAFALRPLGGDSER
jgi:thiamine-phosphate pyrophosphorylase